MQQLLHQVFLPFPVMLCSLLKSNRIILSLVIVSSHITFFPDFDCLLSGFHLVHLYSFLLDFFCLFFFLAKMG